MHPIYPHTHWNSSHVDPSMVMAKYTKIPAHPFKETGITGFGPIKPFKISANFSGLTRIWTSIGQASWN